MTRSPARITAPPRSVASTVLCMFTRRFKRAFDGGGELLGLRGIELHRRNDFDVHRVLDLGTERLIVRGDLRQQEQAPVGGKNPYEVLHPRVQLFARDPGDEVGELGRGPLGVLDQCRDARIGDDLGGQLQSPRPFGKGPRVARKFERCFGIRPRNGGALSHAQPRRRACRTAPRASSHRLPPEQARGAFDRELADFLAQAFARARAFPRRFLVRLGDQPLRLGGGRALGLLDHFVRAFARLIDDVRRAVPRFADDRLRALVGLHQVLLALLGGGESRCDLARALFHRPQNHRPHELHREPDEGDEHEHLHDQREIDVHSSSPDQRVESPAALLSASARR